MLPQGVHDSLPGAQVLHPEMACLLGSPLGQVDSISNEKRQFLKIMGDRFQRLSSHDALILLCNSFAIPKLQYILRTSSCFLSLSLECYDETLREIVNTVSNIYLHKDGPAWLQGILPVTMGGLSICRAVDVAPPSFLASTSSTADIVRTTLPVSLQSLPIPFMHDTLSQWSQGQSKAPPEGTGAHILKCWDHRRCVQQLICFLLMLQMIWPVRICWLLQRRSQGHGHMLYLSLHLG